MSIQFEGLVDVLTTLHLYFDFLNISSKHGKSLIGGLDSGKVNKQFGGNQPAMISSKIVK